MQTKEKIFIPLTNDLLFKETFGKVENIKYLEDLLESCFNYEQGSLKGKVKVSYEATLDKLRYHDKAERCDLVATINDELLVNLEMYSIFNEEASNKSLSYVMRIVATSLNRGDNYSKLKQVIQINFAENIKVETQGEIVNTYNFGFNDDKVKGIIIPIDKAKEISYTNNDRFIRRMQFLSAKSAEERAKLTEGDELLKSLNEWLEEYSNDETLAECFNDNEWNKRIYRREGHDEGKIESKNEIALNMLKENFKPEIIAKVTGLSLEEVTKLSEAKGN